MPFDPGAATGGYLNSVPSAVRLKAVHYTQGGHLLVLGGWVVTVFAAVLIARSGLLPGLQRRLQRRRKRPVTTSLLLALAFLFADDVIELPWSAYSGWWRERAYGLTTRTFAGWLGETVTTEALSMLLLGVFLTALYALMRRAPRLWWAWAGGLTALFFCGILVLSPAFIDPLFNRYTPAPAGSARTAVVALARSTGTPSDRIFVYDGSKQSSRYTAHVSGFGGFARIAMSNVMFQNGADLGEVRAVVAHEMGHYAHAHVVLTAAAFSLLALLGFWAAGYAFPFAEGLIGSGARSLADPAGLPTLAAALSTLALLASPLVNTLSRFEETNADAFSLRTAHEPDGLARALVRTVQYWADSPSGLEEVLFYNHPSVRRRVARAMAWKAAHLREAESQARIDAGAGS